MGTQKSGLEFINALTRELNDLWELIRDLEDTTCKLRSEIESLNNEIAQLKTKVDQLEIWRNIPQAPPYNPWYSPIMPVVWGGGSTLKTYDPSSMGAVLINKDEDTAPR